MCEPQPGDILIVPRDHVLVIWENVGAFRTREEVTSRRVGQIFLEGGCVGLYVRYDASIAMHWILIGGQEICVAPRAWIGRAAERTRRST